MAQVLEVNASDTRGKSDSSIEGGVAGKKANAIREMVTNRNMSFAGEVRVGGKQVLIMDEVDGMSGNGDRGGVKVSWGATGALPAAAEVMTVSTSWPLLGSSRSSS